MEEEAGPAKQQVLQCAEVSIQRSHKFMCALAGWLTDGVQNSYDRTEAMFWNKCRLTLLGTFAMALLQYSGVRPPARGPSVAADTIGLWSGKPSRAECSTSGWFVLCRHAFAQELVMSTSMDTLPCQWVES